MTSAVQASFSREQVTVWLRGLLSVAWADGDFDDHEKDMIASLTQDELAPEASITTLEPISAVDLAKTLGTHPPLAENFLRTAVMVAIADGVYSPPEDALLHEFCHELGLPDDMLKSLRLTLEAQSPTLEPVEAGAATPLTPPRPRPALKPLRPVQDWLDQLDIHDPSVARFLCKMIPPQCPFERDVKVFGRKVVHIPPLCKLNPLYEQLVGLRFRALSFLADDCGEDISPYI
jgi:tellurite resistance protein